MTAPAAPTVTPSARGTRSTLRNVAVPSEHGGWGLTLEPVLVGAIIAPTITTACLGLAAVLAFLARTPLKVLLVDTHRGRRLDRTTTAAAVAAIEVAALLALVVTAVVTAAGAFWWPVAVAAPLVTIELWFDMRSRSRRLVPELCGAVGIAAIAVMAILADGEPASLAVAVWLILAARALSAIVMVRNQIRDLHGRPTQPVTVMAADIGAVAIAVGAVAVEPTVIVGAAAVVTVIAAQHLAHHLAFTNRAVVIGLRQSGFGLVVALATGVGVSIL